MISEWVLDHGGHCSQVSGAPILKCLAQPLLVVAVGNSGSHQRHIYPVNCINCALHILLKLLLFSQGLAPAREIFVGSIPFFLFF